MAWDSASSGSTRSCSRLSTGSKIPAASTMPGCPPGVARAQEAVVLPAGRGRAFPKPPRVVDPKDRVVALRAREVRRIRHANVLTVHREGELAPLLLHRGPANGASVRGKGRARATGRH